MLNQISRLHATLTLLFISAFGAAFFHAGLAGQDFVAITLGTYVVVVCAVGVYRANATRCRAQYVERNTPPPL